MFENIKKKISIYLFRKNFLKNRTSEILSFNKFVSKSQNFLLVASERHEDIDDLKLVINYLEHAGKGITLLLNEALLNFLPERFKKTAITYNTLEKTRFWLPSKELVSKLAVKNFDVTIDLTKDDNIFNAALANSVNSRYRIGFLKENSDMYYNFQVNKSGVQIPDLPKKLLDSLAMF